ncbi:MAG: T9SS type A sorting domain-containing protein [Candidatus Cloacimonetes bacterium]|nr:T9SS type A sorting domain-containing protein [Candidatus Cloacimonadota bacterium]MCK9183993.1 T9SS type A sorting domain-containing protein [Candidatus Cloacimonadota bacterium]
MKKLILFCLLLITFGLSQGFNLNCYTFPNADEPLLIPIYVEDSVETCHPSVLYFPQGFGGWNYWMVHTPYPGSDVAYENPSIVVSSDGLDWVEPDGLVNPVADVYTGTDINNHYNSDPHLMVSPDGSTMHLIWRQKNGWMSELIKLKTSTDGINWSAATTILSVLSTNPVLNETALSPCLLNNGSYYMLWTVNTKVNPRSIYLRYTSDLDTGWSEPVLTDISEFPEGYRVWHMDVQFIDGYYHMLAAVGIPSTQEGRVLYLGKSLDGVHWSFSSQPVMTGVQGAWDARLYRSAFLRDSSGMGYKNWYGSMDHPLWRIGYSEAQISGYLDGPQNLSLSHNYDGENHYSLTWEAANPAVTGYKVYCNHELLATLDPSQTIYTNIVDSSAECDACAVFAIIALYGEQESDPVVRRLELAISNPAGSEICPDLISIYPNPFKDSFSVISKAIPGGKLKLYSCKGQLLGSWDLRDQAVIEVDDSWASGVYFSVFESFDGTRQINKVLRLK